MAKLSAAERHKLAKTKAAAEENFVFPEKAMETGGGSGSYPIHDVGHAKSAIAYGKKNLSVKKFAILKKKVCMKYGQEFSDFCGLS